MTEGKAKVIHRRLSVRNLYQDLLRVLHEHHEALTAIAEANRNGEFEVALPKMASSQEMLTSHRRSPAYTEYGIGNLADHLMEEITPILFDYGVRFTETEADNEMDQRLLHFDDSLSLREVLVALTKTMIPADEEIIEFHLLEGNYLKAYERFNEAMLNPSLMTDDMMFNVYQRALNQIINSCEKAEELTSQFRWIQILVSKERGRKPLKNPDNPDKLTCPYCHSDLLTPKQNYCHLCGQKMESMRSRNPNK